MELETEFQRDGRALAVVAAAVTDAGCRRVKNEDAHTLRRDPEDPARCLFLVADGVGGNAAGEIASTLAVNTIARVAIDRRSAGEVGPALAEAFEAAHREILQRSAVDPFLAGMATTCTGAFLDGTSLMIAHIGDSRAYLARQGDIVRLTVDHSMAAEYERGSWPLPPGHRLSNALTRCLGIGTGAPIDLSERIPLLPDDIVLLCTDGLTKVVTDEEIGEIVPGRPPARAAEQLTELARARGGPDNITVVVIVLQDR